MMIKRWLIPAWAAAVLFIAGQHLAAQTMPGFEEGQVLPPNDRLHIQQKRDLTVATAVPTAAEAKAKLQGHRIQLAAREVVAGTVKPEEVGVNHVHEDDDAAVAAARLRPRKSKSLKRTA